MEEDLSMEKIKRDCHYLYQGLYIPMYIYKNTTLLGTWPEQEAYTLPPIPYLHRLWEHRETVSYLTTSFGSCYGMIRYCTDSSISVILGPVSSTPYSKNVLHRMVQEYVVAEAAKDSFSAFFRSIPVSTLSLFLDHLLLVNYVINQMEYKKEDIFAQPDTYQEEIIERQAEKIYIRRENEYFNNSLEIEQKFMQLIQNGDPDGLRKAFREPAFLNSGIVAGGNLRQQRNNFISAATLMTSAAISGGLEPEAAFQLSDLYIQDMEKLSSPDAVNHLLSEAHLNFASQVAGARLSITENHDLQKVIQYVRQHTNMHLTVESVAEHTGFSRAYLSHKFKTQLGFNLSSFIIRSKLEEAKILLRYSGKSIGEISSYLCFSSQSHFHNAFKKYFGVTPKGYRDGRL